VVREGMGAGGEMTQALYAHMNNKTIKKLIQHKIFKNKYFI
jgi:NaMN:DMB phosphoribosyltransferase